jgi:RNA polymerase sigma factor (sigma-70 family)
VFLAAFRNLGRFSGDTAGFRSWLFTIAHRRLTDERRRRGRRPATAPLDDVEGLVAGDVELEALASVGTDRVRRILDTLPADQRSVLALRILADFTVDQVAAVVGKSPGAVKALQRRGLARLRRMTDREEIPS